MEREPANNSVNIQPESQKEDVKPCIHVGQSDDGNFTFGLNEVTPTESSCFVNLLKKMKKKSRRRPRKHKPGNRKRKSHKSRNRSKPTVRRQIIPRSRLGAPFLCNDMLMAKDGFVFDTCSGKIEFKPDVVVGLSENTKSLDDSCQSRYVPISPDHDHQSLDLSYDTTEQVRSTEDQIGLCLDFNNNSTERIQYPLQESAHASPTPSPTSPCEPDTTEIDLFGLKTDSLKDDEISLYFDDEKDFQFHMQNFEADTERYLRNSLMELSRESLEEEYYTKLNQLRSLQSHKSEVADLLPSCELEDFSSPLENTMDLTEQLKQLSQLATSVSSQLENLQKENTQLKKENCQLQIALGNANMKFCQLDLNLSC